MLFLSAVHASYNLKMLVLSILFLFNCVYCIEEYDPENIPLCVNNNTSCSYLLGDEYSPDFCTKIYYKVNEQDVCDAAYDENAVRSENTKLGRLILNPFYGDTRTVFNVTFVDIKFLVLKIRFQEYFGDSRVLNKCMVKDFVLNDNVPSDKSLTYVCPWSDTSFEGNRVDFHYEYGLTELVTRRKLRFYVPFHENVDEYFTGLYFFIYLDYTDTYNLILNIVPPADRFNVTRYKIDVIYSFANENETKVSDILTADGSDLLKYSFYTTGIIGEYHFRVEPISNYCQNNICTVQETPKIRIVSETSTLLIGMVGVSILIPIFMIIVYMWTKKIPGQLKPKPIVLLVTVPTNNAHIVVAPLLAQFLQETYNIKVMLDVNGVPETKTINNSSDWLKVVMNHVSHIVFLRSNDDLNSSLVIYQNIYSQTMYLLDPKLNSKKKECILSFPYSSETTEISHPELAHIRKRFNFEKDFNKFINFLIYKKVLLINKKNCTYQKLLEAIKSVENEEPANKNQENVLVQVHVSDDENDQNLEIVKNRDSKSINIELNFEKYNLLGEQNKQDDENSSDSDLDPSDFLGDVKFV